MFEVTKKEMDMLAVRLSDLDLPALVVKYREMDKLAQRLKTESNIQDDLSSADRLSLMTVAETA